MKSIAQQVNAMKRKWPSFEAVGQEVDRVLWFGTLVGIQKPYRLMVEYGLPRNPEFDPLWRHFPLVRVLSPQLRPNFRAPEEAPLPHVYFDRDDLANSPLCLFDPSTDRWSHGDLIALTMIPWAADWLTCYEGWLATGRWFGGGRHAVKNEKGAAS